MNNKIYINVVLFLLIIVAVFDLFIEEHDENRFLALYTQGLILAVSFIFFIRTIFLEEIKPTGFHYSLCAFIMMLIIYGIFSPYIDRLLVILYGMVPFYLFYYAAYKGHIDERYIQYLAIILLTIYSIETYLSIIDRSERLDEFYLRADNVGYKSMFLMLLFALKIKYQKNILFLSLAYILVLLSFKRGAMLIATVSYLVIIIPILMNNKGLLLRYNKKLWAGGFVALATVGSLVVQYWDTLVYRFISDPTGSGRADIYALTFQGWANADIINKIVGFGFYSVPQYLGMTRGSEIHAHSDWVQLVYDHGMIGIAIYLFLFFSLIGYNRIIRYTAPEYRQIYLMIICIWLLKSFVSGVYISKLSIMMFIVLGIVLGTTFRKRLLLRYESTKTKI